MSQDHGPVACAAQTALLTELTRLRQRGLERLDSSADHHRPLLTPVLDKLMADRGFDPAVSRVERVIEFIRLALREFSNEHVVESRLISALFFDVNGRAPGPIGPSELLRRARSTHAISSSTFRKLQRQHFLALAAFLLSRPIPAEPAAARPLRTRSRIGWLLACAVLLVAIPTLALLR